MGKPLKGCSRSWTNKITTPRRSEFLERTVVGELRKPGMWQGHMGITTHPDRGAFPGNSTLFRERQESTEFGTLQVFCARQAESVATAPLSA
jgi:hypothetical protein